jgi:small-conductance mechanosensitive channel
MIPEALDLLYGLPLWQATLLVVGLSVAAAVVVEVVVLRVARSVVGRTESRFDDVLFEELRLPVLVTVALAGLYLLSLTPAAAATALGAFDFAGLFGLPALSAIVLAWAWAANRIVNRFVEEVADSGRRYEFAPVFSNVWTLVVLVGAAFALLTLWNVDVTPLLGAAGIAGIAIGFAAKDTVANFFGGLALYFDDTYKVGDFVVLESGDSGTVVKVGIRSTTLLTRDEVLVTVPNAMLNAGRVTNQSAPGRRKRIKVPLAVAYGSDPDEVESVVLDVAADEELVLERPEPRMRLRRLGDSALEYELLCWVPAPNREGKARHRLNRAVYAALRDAGVEIPYPKRDVTLNQADESEPVGRGEEQAPAAED